MTPPLPPIASYRIQLRNGVGFAEVEERLDPLVRLGISHLYLSPIFSAREGSTHGYDVIDPTAIDPVLGGREGFERLASSASSRGLGIILDIVPNHTSLSPESPWLADVLRHGSSSSYAGFFDIDWQAPALLLPVLPEPFDKMLSDGAFTIEGDDWIWGDLRLPLAPGTQTISDLRQLHQAQNWRLVPSSQERDSITHRRFFNITDLIGMRVEDPAVFEATHALIFDLVREGSVQGLRVDHVDGLVDPEDYLTRLAQALPNTPVWIEKILVGDETVPQSWQTCGTTGYESARLVAQLLTDRSGLQRIDEQWRAVTGIEESFEDALTAAKHDILDNELAVERLQLIALADQAAQRLIEVDPGSECLREAVTALLIAMPRYRTYVSPRGVAPADVALLATVTDNAAQTARSDTVIRVLGDFLARPQDAAQLAFAQRFQQVSGALLAKAQEDTAGFRWTRYLAANEVGAEPDDAVITDDDATARLEGQTEMAMNLSSSHDTKRSEDSRMRLVAISHLPDSFCRLHDAARALPEATGLPARRTWYIVQSAIAIWGADNASERLSEHLEKAMREAKLSSFWTNPNEPAETQAKDFAWALLHHWRKSSPDDLRAIEKRAEALVLAQLLLKATMPGFPDFYQGSEDLFLALTDPDNRLSVDWDSIDVLGSTEGIGATKARWTQRLMALRAEKQEFMRHADTCVQSDGPSLFFIRKREDQQLVVRISDRPEDVGGATDLSFQAPDGYSVSLTWRSM